MTHRYRHCINKDCEAIFQLVSASDMLCPDCQKVAAEVAEAADMVSNPDVHMTGAGGTDT